MHGLMMDMPLPDDRHRKVLKSALREKFRQYRVA